jgi:hypothetical protein
LLLHSGADIFLVTRGVSAAADRIQDSARFEPLLVACAREELLGGPRYDKYSVCARGAAGWAAL